MTHKTPEDESEHLPPDDDVATEEEEGDEVEGPPPPVPHPEKPAD